MKNVPDLRSRNMHNKKCNEVQICQSNKTLPIQIYSKMYSKYVFSFSCHYQMSLLGGFLLNKFEQDSSDHHQMSLAGWSTGLMSGGGAPHLTFPMWVPYLTFLGVPYHGMYPMMHLKLPPPTVKRKTPVKTVPARTGQTHIFRLRAVIKKLSF